MAYHYPERARYPDSDYGQTIPCKWPPIDQKNQAPTDNHSPQGHNITNLVLLYKTPH